MPQHTTDLSTIAERIESGSQSTTPRTASNGSSRHMFPSSLSQLTEPTDGYTPPSPRSRYVGTLPPPPPPPLPPAYFGSERDEEGPETSYYLSPQPPPATATAVFPPNIATPAEHSSLVMEVAVAVEPVSGLGNHSACGACANQNMSSGDGQDNNNHKAYIKKQHAPNPSHKRPVLWGIIGVLFVVVVVAAGMIGYAIVGGGDGSRDDSSSASANTDNGPGEKVSPTMSPTTTVVVVSVPPAPAPGTTTTAPTTSPSIFVTQTPTQSPETDGDIIIGTDCPDVPARVPQQNDEDTRLARYDLDWLSVLPLFGAGSCDSPVYSVSATCTNSGHAILFSGHGICSVRQNRVRCTAADPIALGVAVIIGCFGDTSQTNLFVQIDAGATTCYEQSNGVGNAVSVFGVPVGVCTPSLSLECIRSFQGDISGAPYCLQTGGCDLERGRTECAAAYTGARISVVSDKSCLEGFSRTRQVGERCRVDAECLSKICAGRLCRDRPGCSNDDCAVDAHCQDGLVCENEICVPE